MNKRTRWMAIIALLAVGLYIACGSGGAPTGPDNSAPPSGNTNFQTVETTLHFKALRNVLRKPSQVQFLFALRDNADRAVLFSPAELRPRSRIYENDQEIDYSETNFFVSTAESFRLDVVLVLDFTNSMASFQSNGQSAIDEMLAGAEAIIHALGTGHRMALLEFHDRNVDPQVLAYFTSDTTFLLSTLRDFAREPIDHGSTRAWDAVYQGVSLFSDAGQEEDVRLLIFLSDGFDTSSRRTPSEIVKLAQQRNVQLHGVGAGQVTNLDSLQYLTESTGGAYYPARDEQGIQEQLQEIARNLKGQYKLSYVSLQRERNPVVRVEIDYAGATNSFEGLVDVASVYEDDRIGRMSYDEEVVNNQYAKALMRLEHTPRNISAFRFNISADEIDTVEIVSQANGGVLDDTWKLTGPDPFGWYILQSPTATLPFGAFGPLFIARFAPIEGSAIKVPFELDNSIYAGEKRFEFPDTLYLGLALSQPSPADSSRNVSTRITLDWQVADFRNLDPASLRFDVQLDTAATLRRIVATELQSSSFTPPRSLLPNQLYFWRIVTRSGNKTFTGPVWQFETGDK